jgi:hypothetical protein
MALGPGEIYCLSVVRVKAVRFLKLVERPVSEPLASPSWSMGEALTCLPAHSKITPENILLLPVLLLDSLPQGEQE